MIMTLTNNQIYNYLNDLTENFSNNSLQLPIKANFYLQKNIKELLDLAQEVEKERIAIGKKYGTFDEEQSNYRIDPDKLQDAQKDMNELLEIPQEVKIYKLKLEDFGEINLTSKQMQALLFMIEEEE